MAGKEIKARRAVDMTVPFNTEYGRLWHKNKRLPAQMESKAIRQWRFN